MTTIQATGTHESHHRAERATITAHVSIVSVNREQSISSATELHNRIVQRANELRASGDATWHAADPISTFSRKNYDQGKGSKVVIEHVTTSRVRVKLSNLELVSKLVDELSNAGARTNVDWTLTEAFRRECERVARKAAVSAARAVADDYAEALGERIVRVLSISDAPGGFAGGVQARFAADSAGGGAEVTVAEITVSASVQGDFQSA